MTLLNTLYTINPKPKQRQAAPQVTLKTPVDHFGYIHH